MTETIGALTGSTGAVRGLSREGIAERLARDLQDGFVVNLGVGIPLLIPRFIPAGAEVILHAENGVLGLGPAPPPGREDPDLTDAGKNPAVGGAMDLVAGAREVWVVMEHVDRAGRAKIVEECTFPLTGRRVVTRVYTDLAVFHLADGRLRLTECAPGVPPQAIREQTAAPYTEDLGPADG
jgi:3-oxoacid CoA-transferase subunit B